MMLRAILLAAMLIAVPLGGAATAQAQEFRPDRIMPDPGYGYGRERDRDERRAPRARPLREIVEIVRRQRGGDLIDVLDQQGGERPYYVLRWRLDNGVVRDFRVDAQSGQIMGR